MAARKNKKKSKKASPTPAPLPTTSHDIREAKEKDEPSTQAINDLAQKGEKKDEEHSKDFHLSTPGADPVPTEEPETNVALNERNIGDQASKEQSVDFDTLVSTTPWSLWLPKNVKISTFDEFLQTLQPAIQSMYDEFEEMKRQAAASKQDEESSESTTNKEKDELIAQLRYEGEKLAGTELRQSNTIKTLKKRISGMDNDMSVVKEELSKKIRAFEQISNSHEELQSQIQDNEAKNRELSRENERLRDAESRLIESEKEVRSLHSSLAACREDAENESIFLNGEIKALKIASEDQVTHLEAALENLRIELDHASKNTSVKVVHSSIEDEHSMSKELESCKSKWSQLENSLNDKISELEAHSRKMEESKLKLNEQLRCSERITKSLEINLLEEQQVNSESGVKLRELQEGNEKLKKQLQDTTEDYVLLQKKYQIQHTQLELIIGSSEKCAEGSVQSMSSPSIRKEGVITSAEIEDDWMYPPNMSQISPMESSMGFETSSLRKEVDELTDHPAIENADDKLSTNGMDIPDEAAALASSAQEISLPSKNSTSISYRRHSTQVEVAGKMNAHMISKLGAEVRRYEAELVSLQNTCDRLQKEKNEASNEILNLLEENEKVQSITKEKDELDKKLKDAEKTLEVTLQLLGEKTEQVEELENDVVDLKEMIHQQVQQYLELQENMS